MAALRIVAGIHDVQTHGHHVASVEKLEEFSFEQKNILVMKKMPP